MDVDARGQHLLAVRQYLCRRWLVGDEGPDLLRMAGHQGERVHRPTAGREDVHRSGIERRDQPVQVVGVLIRRGFGGAVGPPASLRPAGVERDDRPVREVSGQGDEPLGAHR